MSKEGGGGRGRALSAPLPPDLLEMWEEGGEGPQVVGARRANRVALPVSVPGEIL